ncbi:MAG: PKD domain-containing protein [bacterium]|nr:PKD domain-containing protein [bacterium]
MFVSTDKVKFATAFVCLVAAILLVTCAKKSVEPENSTPPIPVGAHFGVSDTSGAPPLTILFTDSSSGNPDFWFWRFGDGQTSFQQHPSHQYNSEGVYDVTLVVSRGEVRDSTSRSGLIRVDDSAHVAAPIAGFVGDPLTGNAPLTVQFSNQSTGTISNYEWSFGDGATSPESSPSHDYPVPGVYTVRLIVDGPGGADTLTRTDYITALVPPPTALFDATPTTGQPPLVVSFTNQSTGSITAYKWYFGDGDSSDVRNPSHSYENPGLYSVTLIAIGPGGTDTNTIDDYIAVSAGPPIAAFTGAPTNGIAPMTVQFTNNSAGTISSYDWNFGDNATSTSANPSHQYTAAGQYSVRLIVTGPGGADTTQRTNYIVVQSAPPVADFSANPTFGLVPLTVNFSNLSTGDITGYLWSFGDGGTSTETSPTHQYTTSGTFSVRLITTGPGGVDTLLRANLITATWPAPIAAFTGLPTNGQIPFDVIFTNNSSGQISSYEWSFGDGGTSTSANPTHSYTTAGRFTVRLIANGPGGADTLTRENYINAVYPPPVAGFTGAPTQGTVPFAVNFTNSSTGQITSYAWEFGDGGTSTAASPSHSYTAHGLYDVRLIVSGPGGADTLLRSDYITANAITPTAEFTSDVTRGNIPLTVRFTDQSTGIIDSWNWRFGTTITSALRIPSITFTNPGLYDVRLIVTGPGGTDTIIKPGYIEALPPVPTADFTGSPTDGDAPLTVAFTNLSQGTFDSYEWNFGDGATSLELSPSHQYTVAGIYDVRLIIRGPGGADTLTRVSYVTVRTPRPIADFDADLTLGTAPLSVQFANNSIGEIDLYHWSFGDGTTSNLENPTHEFVDPGTYDIRLIVVGPGGEDTLTRPAYIVVNPPPPVAAFEGNPTSGVAPLVVQFSDLSQGTIESFDWDFGDGAVSTEQSPSHSYDTPGLYTVSLTVTGPGGSDSMQRINYISVAIPPPTADFSADPVTGTAPLEVTFTSLATGQIDKHEWDFGDGNLSEETNPVHIYQNVGSYTVRLIVSGPGGSDTLTRVDLISAEEPGPIANFDATPLSGIAPLDVQFNDLSTGVILTHFWNFGDGATSILSSPTHQYVTPGTYSVTLVVVGVVGLDSLRRTDYIVVNEPPPVAAFSANTTSGTVPLEVTFGNQSTGTIDSFVWDFGDGNSSIEKEPIHQYLNPGLYTVRLIVTGPGGSDTLEMIDYISVLGIEGTGSANPTPKSIQNGTKLSPIEPMRKE